MIKPGNDRNNLEYDICAFHVAVKMYSILFARHKKLNILKYIRVHSGVNTYTTQYMMIQIKSTHNKVCFSPLYITVPIGPSTL